MSIDAVFSLFRHAFSWGVTHSACLQEGSVPAGHTPRVSINGVDATALALWPPASLEWTADLGYHCQLFGDGGLGGRYPLVRGSGLVCGVEGSGLRAQGSP